jgi:hypothetical protein
VLATALHAGFTVDEMINLDLSYAPPYSPVWVQCLLSHVRWQSLCSVSSIGSVGVTAVHAAETDSIYFRPSVPRTNSSLTATNTCGLANTCYTLATLTERGQSESIPKMDNLFLEVIPIEELEVIVGS